jgi:hypothetical protein
MVMQWTVNPPPKACLVRSQDTPPNLVPSYNGYYAGLSIRTQGFDPPWDRQVLYSYRLSVRTPGFHPGKRGSIPRSCTSYTR